MTKRQRFLTAVGGGVPDKVPVAPLIHDRYAHKMLGRSGWRAVFEVHQMIGSVHYRGPLGVGLRSSMPDGYAEEIRELERSADGRVLKEWVVRTPERTMRGEIVEGVIPDDPLVYRTVEYPVKSREDWLAYLGMRRHWLENVEGPDFGDVPTAVEVMGEEGVASVGILSPYAELASRRGMAEFMMDCHDKPRLIEELLDVEGQIMEKRIEAFVAAPTEVAWLDNSWASGSDLGPKWFERWALPEVVRAMEKLRGTAGKYLGLYSLGRIRRLLPMFVDAGVHFVETFEPNQGDITLAEAKRLYGDKMCIMGNFDCLVLARGSVEDARQEALRCLREGMEGGGFVLVTADEVPADTRLDNLKAMVETAEEHGSYS
jgi:uroporphyrinogen-III decarboxylase